MVLLVKEKDRNAEKIKQEITTKVQQTQRKHFSFNESFDVFFGFILFITLQYGVTSDDVSDSVSTVFSKNLKKIEVIKANYLKHFNNM